MTSVSEEVVMPSAGANSHSELNGDFSVNSDLVPSVHDNIFFKAFGRPSKHPTHSRLDGIQRRNSTDTDTSLNNDVDVGEYRPGSGFVSRLLGKFTNLSLKEENVSQPLKRSSSLEDVTTEKETIRKPISPKESSYNKGFDKSGSGIFPKLVNKAESIDCLNQNHTLHRQRPTFPVSLRRRDSREHVDRQPKSPRESQIIAPDADLARENIVIIENPPAVPPLALDISDDSSKDGSFSSPHILSYRDEAPPEELPKPNTVLNVRSIFETASAASSTTVVHGRRHKSDSFSDLKNEKTESSSSRDKNEKTEYSSSRDKYRIPYSSSISPVTSPRIYSPDARPPSWLSASKGFSDSSAASTPSSTVSSDLTTNYTRSSSQEDRPRSLSNTDITSPISKETKSSSVFDRGTLFDSGKILEFSRPAPSPRSTASVKPTIASKPVTTVSVKPIPITPPPSAATSFKKSPVVPVAPFKKQEENVDDGTPVMIYQKPKSPTRKVQPERAKKYDDIPSKTDNDKEQDEPKDLIIPTEGKKIFENDNNRILDKSEQVSSSSDLSKRRTVENNITNNREKTFSFIKPSVNDVDNNDLQDNNKDVSSVSVGRDRTTISIGSNSTRITVSKDPENIRQPKKNKAPSPNKLETVPTFEKQSSKLKRAPEPPSNKNDAKEDKPQSMIYISSSSSGTETSESEASPPETPRTQPVKVSQPENNDKPPVKGIPSIIAKRLNKQVDSPRDVSNSIADSNDSDSGTGKFHEDAVDGRPSLLKNNREPVNRIIPADKEPTKDVISSEIENEIAAVRKKMDSSRTKSSGPAQIFDSSQLAKKRKENQRLKAEAAAASQGIVPRLDFSSLNEDKNKNNRAVQKEIKPCNIKFIGENAKTSRSLLKKQRKVKVNVQFSVTISETFEYPNEDRALEAYLEDHPNEPKELEEEENTILFLDGFGGGGDLGESSDDAEVDGDTNTLPDTPRRDMEEESLKSTPALSSTSNSLQSYRGRFQEDFVFGSSMKEPEPAPQTVNPDPASDPDSMMLRPADEQDIDIWSTNNSSDLLF